MGEEAFVYGKQPFRLDSFTNAVCDARVEVSGLIVHARHYGIFLRVSVVSSFVDDVEERGITYLVGALHSRQQIRLLHCLPDATPDPLPYPDGVLTFSLRKSMWVVERCSRTRSSP